ncbi:unnamed protein product [Mytilus edulis]|uniref:Uncharacterized protein n=1 Tax=Mytilus edulis TaxID=6550 RepID=A0A8S3U082_MYTED|nr:unnamed protein product [Mytilus edulis]
MKTGLKRIHVKPSQALADHEQVYNTIRKDSTDNEENKNYLLDKICRALEDREHIYNKTKDDVQPETKVKQDLDRTNLDEYYGMRNSFDDIEDERRQRENNDDSYHLTELKSITNHTAIENNEVECEISDVSIINSFDEVNEENSDGQVNLIEDNEAIYESIRDEDSLKISDFKILMKTNDFIEEGKKKTDFSSFSSWYFVYNVDDRNSIGNQFEEWYVKNVLLT